MRPLWVVSYVMALWLPWPILAAWTQRRRGRSISMGVILGLALGPIGLLIASYPGGSRCPDCRARVDRAASLCMRCGAAFPKPLLATSPNAVPSALPAPAAVGLLVLAAIVGAIIAWRLL
jgi:hypothetical protein